MGQILTIFCDKGGVGKTTITLMLAHGLSAIHNKSVLVMDLDETPRVSEALMGREKFLSGIPDEGRVSSLIQRLMFLQSVNAFDYIRAKEGALKSASGKIADLALIPGDRFLAKNEDLAIGHIISRYDVTAIAFAQRIAGGAVKRAIQLSSRNFDFVIIDSPPRVSHFLKGALDVSDLVLVPFEPGRGAGVFLTETGMKIERVATGAELKSIPLSKRRYAVIPNRVKTASSYGHEANIEELHGEHPHVGFNVPDSAQLAKLIESPGHMPVTIQERCGTAAMVKVVSDLSAAVTNFLHKKLTYGVQHESRTGSPVTQSSV